jgi:uncharacterized membrane protein
MEELFKTVTAHIANVVELLAALVIILAVVKAGIDAIVAYFRRPFGRPNDAIRLQLGRWLALALELTLAADILETAVAPSWDAIGRLAAIVVLRTFLNYFLQRDVEHAEKRGASNAPH